MAGNDVVQRLVDSYGDWFKDEEKLRYAKMEAELYPYDSIFSPIQINHLTIKNRLVMAPMGNVNMAEETGRPNQQMLEYFFERARGGVGLITTGLIPISHGVDATVTELGKLSYFPRIDRSRTVFAGWRDLAQGVHAYGARIFVQLTAGLGRVGNPQCLITQTKFPPSASFNPNFYISQIPCLRMSGRRIKKIVKGFGQGAADAKTAGLDGVYLHGHEGYLMEQLTNPAFNRRKLGRYADWQAFGIDSVREIRTRVGPRYPIMYRIDLSLALNETYGLELMAQTSMKKFTKGRTVEMTLDYMENLVKAGVDIFDVDLGCYDNWWLPHPPASMPPACYLEVATIVKEHFAEKGVLSNAGVAVPIVGVGKLGYPDLAEKALREGACDMVMLGRPLLADPAWPSKAYAGECADIRPCIGCQEGCINEFVEGGHPQCAVNPRTAFEHEYAADLPAAVELKRIGVVGAGPAGITAALTAARRGHMVELFEGDAQIGGKVVSGGVAKIKYEMKNYRDWLEREVAAAVDAELLTLHLNTEVTAEELKAAGFDALVLSAGGFDIVPPFARSKEIPTITATDLILHPEKRANAKQVVIIGGGVVGCETAYWLKYELGIPDVSVVEMDTYIMNHTCTANRGHLIHYLKRAGVPLLNCTTVVGLSADGVEVVRNVSKTVPDPYNTWAPILPENIENPLAPRLIVEEQKQTLSADLVVLAMGYKPNDALLYEAQRIQAAPELHVIGDNFAAGKVHEATRSAYRLALSL
ncbi:MAG: FAD-dependent oxidoreductase [Coriobacteriales bacterium]|jgi:2-enoate reductase|nr:FAD-dependent oxidoreductase [Coriobacteriales bacterium]